MTSVFETKVAEFSEIDDRMETLSQAIRAFVDCWSPRLARLQEEKRAALAEFDAPFAVPWFAPRRAALEAHYDRLIEELCREGQSRRRALDRLVEFYANRESDGHASVLH